MSECILQVRKMVDMRLKNEIPYSDRFNIDLENFDDSSVFYWDLSVRTENCLRGEGIKMQSELLRMSEVNLLEIKNFGAKSLREIETYINLISDEQKTNCNIVESRSYVIPSNLKNYVDDLIEGDLDKIIDLSLSLNEQKFLERFSKEAPFIDKSFREDAYLSSDEIIDIVIMLRSFIYNNERKNNLRVKLSQLLDKTNVKRLKLNMEPFLSEFGDDDLKTVIVSTYPNMKIGDINIYVDLVTKFDVSEKTVNRLLKFVTFDINEDFNLAVRKIIKNERDLIVISERANCKTLEEIGKKFGVTRERVRQIESKVIKKLILWSKKYRLIEKIFALNDNVKLITIDELLSEIETEKKLFGHIIYKYLDELNNYEYIEEIDSVVMKSSFDKKMINKIIKILPEHFDDEEIDDLLQRQISDVNLLNILKKYIHTSYFRTGRIYHRKKMSLSEIYKRVLYTYYPRGLKVYDSEVLSEFRQKVVLDFGDIELPMNDRAISARIADISIICDRGTYISKERVNFSIDPQLISDVRLYIINSKRDIVLISSIFNVFSTRLIMNGVDNRYYLHGILREVLEDDYFFTKDCILKNKSENSISDEICNFIHEFNYPITQDRIREEFPGATDVMIGRAIVITDVVNMFGKYIHIDKLGIDENKKKIIDEAVKEIISDLNVHHAKDLYHKIECERPTFWKQICVDYPFSAFSVAELLLGEKYQFERPFFSVKGLEISGKEELLRLEFENENQFSVTKVHELAKQYNLSFPSIYSLLKIILDSHYLINKNSLIKEENISLSNELIKEIEEMIISSLVNEQVLLIRLLPCLPKLPEIGYKWNEWLLLSFIKKHSIRLEVELSSRYYSKSYPIVSLAGYMNREKYMEIELNDKEDIVHDMSNVEDLLDDLIEIEF